MSKKLVAASKEKTPYQTSSITILSGRLISEREPKVSRQIVHHYKQLFSKQKGEWQAFLKLIPKEEITKKDKEYQTEINKELAEVVQKSEANTKNKIEKKSTLKEHGGALRRQ